MLGEGSILCFPCAVVFQLFLGLTFFFLLCLTWPIFVYRYLLSVLAPCFRPDLGRMLCLQSSFFARTKITVGIRFGLSGKLNVPHLVDQLSEGCILLKDKESGDFVFPEFQQYFTTWLGYYFFRNEEKFEMSKHVKHLVLEKDHNLEEEFTKVLNTPFLPSLSPWEFTFVETQETANRHYIWFKFHHALGDGYSVSNAIMGAADSKVNKFQHTAEEPVSCWLQVLRGFNFFFTYFRVLNNLVIPNSGPWDSRDLTSDRYEETFIDPIPFGSIKDLSQKFGVSVSTILISIVSGAMRRKFLEEGASEPPNGIRGSTPIHLPHHSNKLTNKL